MALDWMQYWFMLPVAALVATTAMLTGTGGATYFTPFFLLFLPWLGPQYALPSTASSIGAALLTMVFGFASGFVGYWRRGLIDYRSAVPFVVIAVPVGCAGALMLATLRTYDTVLIAVYAALLFLVAVMIGRRGGSRAGNVAGGISTAADTRRPRMLITRDGTRYSYRSPRLGLTGGATTAIGAFLTGLLGIGIGEAIMPQLIRRDHFPLPVAAGVSVFATILTIACASAVQIVSLGTAEIPWHLVCYTIPGVILGGQLGPRLQGRIPQRAMERAIATLFCAVGLAMGYVALRKFGLA